MNRKSPSGMVLSGVVALLSIAAAGVSAAPLYTVTDLIPASMTPAYAYSVNSAGQAVGSLTTSVGGSAQSTPYVWKDGLLTVFGSGAMTGVARCISASGDASGSSGSSAAEWHGATAMDLGVQGEAAGINRTGLCVGVEWRTVGGIVSSAAFTWTPLTGKVNLPALGGGSCRARSCNDTGDVVGEAQTGSGVLHACLWRDGKAQDLGTLGGPSSTAQFITNDGTVVGGAATEGGPRHAFVWTGGGGMVDIGTLPGYLSSYAWGANGALEVVGTAASADDSRAFLWYHSRMRDLNTLIPESSGWVLKVATSISSNGQIAGWGTHDGRSSAFLLRPIVPSAIQTLMAAGGLTSTTPDDVSLLDTDSPPGAFIDLLDAVRWARSGSGR